MGKSIDVLRAKKSEFAGLPRIEFDSKNTFYEFDSIVIIPRRKKHESGWACMEYAAFDGNECIGVFGGRSDVLHLNGIAGSGLGGEFLPETMPRLAWRIDCLPCGYIHLWCDKRLVATGCLSDFQLYVKKEASQSEL